MSQMIAESWMYRVQTSDLSEEKIKEGKELLKDMKQKDHAKYKDFLKEYQMEESGQNFFCPCWLPYFFNLGTYSEMGCWVK